MSGRPTLGLAIIARDEEKSLPTLLASIEGAFDRVVLVDTGSKDRTVRVFSDWAHDESNRRLEQGASFGWDTKDFAWTDDFSAARNYADSLLTTDWIAWADADDEVEGADQLRGIVANAPDHVVGLVADYDYAFDAHGNCISHLRRERVVRRGAGRWEGAIHEAQKVDGDLAAIPPERVKWVHRKVEHGKTSPRNLRALRKWAKREPDNPRVVQYLGSEELGRGNHAAALRHFRRYLRLATVWDEERAQVLRRAAICAHALGEQESAERFGLEGVGLMPDWTDSYLTLAEVAYGRGQWEKAAFWAREVIRRGTPQTMLVVDPSDYTVTAPAILAGALAQLGEIEEAMGLAEGVLERVPNHDGLLAPYQAWRAQLKRDRAAESFVSSAALLVAHDEQVKALELLGCVPYFATDHPKVVSYRSWLRERVEPLLDPVGYAEHYTTGGSKPEDIVADDRVAAVVDSLPRAHLLVEGLREQAAA